MLVVRALPWGKVSVCGTAYGCLDLTEEFLVERSLPPALGLSLRFTRETEAALGPVGKRLMDFTRLAERLLYSRHEPSAEDMEETRLLSENIEKGLGSETK